MSVETPLAVLLMLQLPLLLIWLYVVWDISHQDMPRGRKLLWAGACSVVWPVQFFYLLARPQRGRAERSDRRRTRHAQFVQAVLERESGQIDQVVFLAMVEQLVGQPAAPPHPPGPEDVTR